MAPSRCLLLVADYPFVEVGNRLYAAIPWDSDLADLYQPAFQRILLLGRRRRADEVPQGWVPVDEARFEVLDAGDWESPFGFLANLPRVISVLRHNWHRVAVAHLKLFYLTSVATWWYNRMRLNGDRKPMTSLLVGDAPDAIMLRDDLLPFRWARTLASRMVAASIRAIQRHVEVPGFVAHFLANKFAGDRPDRLVVNESWLKQAQILLHDRHAPRSPATVLFVGRLIALKRPHLLVRAVADLVQQGFDLKLVLVGDGPERAGLEAMTRDLGMSSRVRFTGWISLLSPEMLATYDGADIFCLPSFTEGMPMVLVEAMGRGAAVIATAVSGTPEAVEHEQSGLLIPRDDEGALLAAIRRFLTEPDLWRRCVDGGYLTARRMCFEQRQVLASATAALVQ